LLYLNIALPLIYGLAFDFYFQDYFQNHKSSALINTIVVISFLLMNVMLIISGVILVSTVFAIRHFYKKRNAMDALDTGALARHASAFALFLLAVLVYSIAYVIIELWPSSLTNEIFLNANYFYGITSFIS
jgi:hypothetical protein